MKNPSLVDVSEVLQARTLIRDKINRTPMVSSTTLGERLGIKLFFKAESFQKTGSFKLRGALNKMYRLSDEEKRQGVITMSAGNHGAGVAYAAAQLGIEATIVMPEKATLSKVEAIRGYGGKAVLHGTGKDLMPKVSELQEKHHLTFIHPFDDPHVIAGQGTVGLEILEDVPAPDVVICGVGGGGSISGIATAVKAGSPRTKIYGVEPTGAAAVSLSLQQGSPVHLEKTSTIADGLAAPFAGELTLAHIKAYVEGLVLVSDDEIVEALRLIMERCKLVIEPSAAAGFAALLTGKIAVTPGATVVCFLSGGNVDRSRLKEIL